VVPHTIVKAIKIRAPALICAEYFEESPPDNKLSANQLTKHFPDLGYNMAGHEFN